ncbi:MAG TPA: FAD-binding protein, partial [Nannocystis exedens]|nr:FAD-binding protein [Nannocystis exedens]
MGQKWAERGLLSALLYIEILTEEQNFASIVEYFAKYSIRRWAVHESEHKIWLKSRSADSVNIVLSRAVSARELQRVRATGTSVVDIGLLVNDLDSVLARARAAGESEDSVLDSNMTSGKVRWAKIRSPVASIVHTLVERCSYDGASMPGWRPVPVEGLRASGDGDEIVGLSAVDHITLVCSHGTMNRVAKWYQAVLDLRDPSGATTLQSGSGGLRLMALSSRQLDAEVHVPALTLTLVESLGQSRQESADQVSDFIADHGMPGVQHVAFFAPDMLATGRLLRGRGVEFISAPSAYYRNRQKEERIRAVGLSVEDLRAGQILFDDEVGGKGESRGYLLQIFTPPIFERETMFVELIDRSFNSTNSRVEGFGAGNIRDLFRAVAESRAQAQRPMVQPPSGSDLASVRPDPRTQELYRRMQAECASIFAQNTGSGPREAEKKKHPVIVIGAGLCGLTAALALVEHGVRVTLVESRAVLPQGTRAVTWVRSTLELFDSLGIGDELSRHAVSWARGVIRRGPTSALDWRAPIGEGEYPAYTNIPQFVVHAELLKRLARSELCTLMFHTTVTGLAGSLSPDGMVVHAQGPEGDSFSLVGRIVVDASGAHSEWRSHLAGDFESSCEGAFLIADLHADTEQALPEERVFWFDAPFHDDGQTFLMLPQPGGVLRMDFGLDRIDDELGALATAQERSRRALALMREDPRYAAWRPDPASFRLGWSSLYSYASGVIDTAIEGRLLWIGDSLKRVSPFGARGGNEGVRDAAALAWRLAWVLREGADASLLAGYSEERIYSAQCDVMINRGTMRFIHPPASMRFLREAVLTAYESCQEDPSIGKFINTGRFPLPPPSLRGLSTFSREGAQNGDWSAS